MERAWFQKPFGTGNRTDTRSFATTAFVFLHSSWWERSDDWWSRSCWTWWSRGDGKFLCESRHCYSHWQCVQTDYIDRIHKTADCAEAGRNLQISRLGKTLLSSPETDHILITGVNEAQVSHGKPNHVRHSGTKVHNQVCKVQPCVFKQRQYIEAAEIMAVARAVTLWIQNMKVLSRQMTQFIKLRHRRTLLT